MPQHLPIEMAGDDDAGPVVLRKANSQGKKITLIRSVLLSATTILNGDNLALGKRPKGSRFLGGRLTSGVSLGATTVAVGIAGTTGKYKAAAVFTAVDTPTTFGLAAAIAGETTADEDLIMTFAAANAPTSANYVTVEIDLLLGS